MDALLDEFEQFVNEQEITFLPKDWRQSLLAYNEATEEQSKRDCEVFVQALKRMTSVTYFKVDEKTNKFEQPNFNPLSDAARELFTEHVSSMGSSLKKLRDFFADEESDARLSVTVSDMVDLFAKCADCYALSVDISESPIVWAEAETRYAQTVDNICLGKRSNNTVQSAARESRTRRPGCLGTAVVLITQLIIILLYVLTEFVHILALLNSFSQSLVNNEGALSGLLPVNAQVAFAQATNTTVPVGQNATFVQKITGYVQMVEASIVTQKAFGIKEVAGKPVPSVLKTFNEDTLIEIQYVLSHWLGGGLTGVLLFLLVNRLVSYVYRTWVGFASVRATLKRWYDEQKAKVFGASNSTRPPEPDENDVAGNERMMAYYAERARVARNAATALIPYVPERRAGGEADRNARIARLSQNDDNGDSDDDKDDKPRRISATRSQD